jgi:hypothetical protein
MANERGEFDLLTLTDVAKRLRCSKAHIGKVVAGRVPGCAPLPCIALGRRKLVRRVTLDDWIEENEHTDLGTKIMSSPERDARFRA